MSHSPAWLHRWPFGDRLTEHTGDKRLHNSTASFHGFLLNPWLCLPSNSSARIIQGSPRRLEWQFWEVGQWWVTQRFCDNNGAKKNPSWYFLQFCSRFYSLSVLAIYNLINLQNRSWRFALLVSSRVGHFRQQNIPPAAGLRMWHHSWGLELKSKHWSLHFVFMFFMYEVVTDWISFLCYYLSNNFMGILCSGIVFCHLKFRNTVKAPYNFPVESSAPAREDNPLYAAYVGFIFIFGHIKIFIHSSALWIWTM